MLIPAAAPNGGDANFTITIAAADFNRSLTISAEAEGLPRLTVTAPADGDECATRGSEGVQVSGNPGCVTRTNTGSVSIRWDEGWTYVVAWTHDPMADPDTEIIAILEWLERWVSV